MKRDFDHVLKNMDGSPILQGPLDPSSISAAISSLDEGTQALVVEALKAQGVRQMTLASAAAAALGGMFDDEKALPDDERMKRWRLGTRVVDGGEQEITPDERDRIKKVVSKAYRGSVVSPQVHEFLEDDA